MIKHSVDRPSSADNPDDVWDAKIGSFVQGMALDAGAALVKWEDFHSPADFTEPFTRDDELYLYVQDGRDASGNRTTDVIVGVHGTSETAEYRTFTDVGVAWAWMWAMHVRYVCKIVACPSATEFARRAGTSLTGPSKMFPASC